MFYPNEDDTTTTVAIDQATTEHAEDLQVSDLEVDAAAEDTQTEEATEEATE